MKKFIDPRLGFPLGLSLLLGACSHAPPVNRETDPKILLAQACKPGQTIRSTQGSVWLKARSKDASGQFPATVAAQAPDRLKLEVTNLLGGTEAIITVQGVRYTIEVPDQKKRTEKGYDTWGGIPLRWATDLFLGKIPCPPSALMTTVQTSITSENELLVVVPAGVQGNAERFVYRFRTWGGAPWAESLHWERAGALSAAVDFTFDSPDNKTGSPMKWEATSLQGEVKARWKDREVNSQK